MFSNLSLSQIDLWWKKNLLSDIFIYSLTFFQFIYFYSCEKWEISRFSIKFNERNFILWNVWEWNKQVGKAFIVGIKWKLSSAWHHRNCGQNQILLNQFSLSFNIKQGYCFLNISNFLSDPTTKFKKFIKLNSQLHKKTFLFLP